LSFFRSGPCFFHLARRAKDPRKERDTVNETQKVESNIPAPKRRSAWWPFRTKRLTRKRASAKLPPNLITELTKSGKFIVSSATKMDKLLEEQKLGNPAPSTPRRGKVKILALNAIVTGSISQFA